MSGFGRCRAIPCETVGPQWWAEPGQPFPVPNGGRWQGPVVSQWNEDPVDTARLDTPSDFGCTLFAVRRPEDEEPKPERVLALTLPAQKLQVLPSLLKGPAVALQTTDEALVLRVRNSRAWQRRDDTVFSVVLEATAPDGKLLELFVEEFAAERNADLPRIVRVEVGGLVLESEEAV